MSQDAAQSLTDRKTESTPTLLMERFFFLNAFLQKEKQSSKSKFSRRILMLIVYEN